MTTLAQKRPTNNNHADNHSAEPETSNNLVASNWRPLEKNTLRGFFSLLLPSGLLIHGLTAHMQDKRRWVGLPGQRYVKPDGTFSQWAPVVEIRDRARANMFRDAALAALDELLATLPATEGVAQ